MLISAFRLMTYCCHCDALHFSLLKNIAVEACLVAAVSVQGS